MPYQKIPPKQWPARNEVRELARQHTVKAMERLIELMDADSQFVAVNAARTVLMRGEPERPQSRRMRRSSQRSVSRVSVEITPFKQEKQGGSQKRDRKLPVVPGRREGSRDAGDGEGT